MSVAGVLLFCASANALPSGLVVEEGRASVDTASPDTLVITASDRAVLSFETFSIAQDETVRFVLPDSDSILLSRVTGGAVSDIWGTLLSNGRVLLVNPSGIHIADTASVRTQDFIASTLDIQNALFLADQCVFEAGPGSEGSIINDGSIESGDGGNVVLLAQQVANHGRIRTTLGRTVLASGQRATLSFNNEGLVNLVIDEALASRISSESPTLNTGEITAAGGRVTLTSEVLGDALTATVNNTGVIEAVGVVEKNGVIELVSSTSSVATTGSLASTSIGIRGREVELTGTLKTAQGTEAVSVGDVVVSGDLTVQGDLTLRADSDRNGQGSILQASGTTIEVSGDLTLRASGISRLASLTVTDTLSFFAQTPGASYQLTPGSQVQAGSVHIGPEVTLDVRHPDPANADPGQTLAPITVFQLEKNWTNQGLFLPGNSRVEFSGIETSVISGDNTFHDFYTIAPEKTLEFQSGKTQNFTGALTLQGSYGKLLNIRSTQAGTPWMIGQANTSDIKFTSLQDTVYVYAHGPPSLDVSHSKNLGNNSNLSFGELIFTGSASDSWLDGSSWSGGFIPGIGDAVLVVYTTPDTVWLPEYFEASSITVRSQGDLITRIGSQLVAFDPQGDAWGGSIWIESASNIGLQGLIRTGTEGGVTVKTLGKAVMMPTSTILSPGGEVRINQPTEQGFTGVYANVATLMYPGSVIDARGGVSGGFVEVSGEVLNVDQGSIKAAEILFDPASITFSTGADANVTGFAPDADVTEALADDAGLASVFRVDGTPGSILLDVDDGVTITFEASGDITISNAFNLNTATGDDNVNLVLRAKGNIVLTAGITATGTGAITLIANWLEEDAAGNVSGAGNLTTAGGSVTVETYDASTYSGAVSTSGGDFSWTNKEAAVATTFSNSISTGAGSITILAKGGITLSGGSADITATSGNIIIAADWDSGVDYNGDLSGVFSTASGQDITTTSGNISIYSADNPTYAGIIDTTSGGDISVTNYDTGALTISVGLSTDAGDIALSSGGNVTLSAGIDLTATTGNITVTADSEVNGVGVFSTASGQDITTTSGHISITGGDAATYAGVIDTTSGGNISIVNNDASGSITLSVSLSTDAGSITIESKQAITLGADVDLTATTGNITVRANTDQNTQGVFDTDAGQDITTTSGNILIETGDTPDYAGVIDTTSGGDISITNVEAAGTITLSVSLSTGAGDITISSKANLTFAADVDLTTTTGSITVTADSDLSGAGSFSTASGNDFTTTTGGITLYSADNMTLNGLLTTSGGDVSVSVPDTDLNIGNTISTGSGDVTLSANRDVNLTATASDITTTGSVTITADLDGDFIGNYSSVSGSVISTTTGAVLIDGSDVTSIAGDITTTGGDVTINNNDDTTLADTTISGAISTGGGLFEFTAATSGISISGSISTTSGEVRITGRTFALSGSINSGTSTTTLQPNGNNTVGIGTSSTGTFNVTDAEADLITASALRIGSASSSGAVDVRTISPANTTVLSIIAGGALSQTSSTTITETSVRITASDTVTLQSGNAIDNIAVAMSNAGSGFTIDDPNSLTVTTVDGVAGITTNAGAVSITAPSGITLSANITTDGTANAATVTLTGAVTLGAGVTIDTDEASGTDGNITFSSTINGAQTLSLQSGSGTITFNGIVGGSTPMSYLETLGTVTQSAAVNAGTFLHGTGTWTSGANAIDVGGFTNTGTFNAPSTTLNVGGSFLNSGTFTHNSGTVTFDGASGTADLTSGGSAFNDLTINDSGGTLTVQLEAALDVNGNLTITGGTLDTKSGESNSINLAGNWANSDTFTARSGTVTLDGAADQTVTTNAQSFYNLVINNTGAGGSDDIIISGALDVSGDFMLTNGDLDLSTNDPATSFAGNFTIGASGSMDTASYSGTTTFDASSGTKTITSNAQSFNNVTFNDGGGPVTWVLEDALDVNGNLTITGGTLDTKSGENNAITLAGNWTNNDTFTARTGTVTIDGIATTFAGTTTFHHLSVTNGNDDHVDITLTFTAGTTTTISGSLTLNGLDADDRILIRSTAASAATIDFTGSSTFTGDYLDVEWNIVTDNSSGLSLPLDPDDSTDGGDTVGWFAANITGIVYLDEGLTHIGAGVTVAISVNGGVASTGVTDASGAYEVEISVGTGQVMTVYIDGHLTHKGVMVTIADGATVNGYHVYKNYLLIRSETATAVTNTHLDTANNGDSDIDAIYTTSGVNLTMGASTELLVNSGDTYTPGGTVSAVNFDLNGTFVPGNNAVTITGNWDSTGGTFTNTDSTVTFSGDSTSTRTITSGGQSFNNLVLNGRAHWTNSDALSISGTLTITAGGLYQTTSNITTGAVSIAQNGSWINNSTGDITLSGNVSVSGLVMFNGNGAASPDNEIVITSSNPLNNRTWSTSGTGVIMISDVDASDQDGSITVYDSDDTSDNGWTFDTGVQGILWDNGGADNLTGTDTNWSGDTAVGANHFLVFNDTSDSDAKVNETLTVRGAWMAYEYTSSFVWLDGYNFYTTPGSLNQRGGPVNLGHMLRTSNYYNGADREAVFKFNGPGEYASVLIAYIGLSNTISSATGIFANEDTESIDLSRIVTTPLSGSGGGGGFGLFGLQSFGMEAFDPDGFDWGEPGRLPGQPQGQPQEFSSTEISELMAGQMNFMNDPFSSGSFFSSRISLNPDRD